MHTDYTYVYTYTAGARGGGTASLTAHTHGITPAHNTSSNEGGGGGKSPRIFNLSLTGMDDSMHHSKIVDAQCAKENCRLFFSLHFQNSQCAWKIVAFSSPFTFRIVDYRLAE